MSTDLATLPITPLARVTANEQLLKAIGPHVERHYVKDIKGRRYVMVAGAQAVATGLGLTTSTESLRYVEATDSLPGYWEACAAVLNERGTVVARGLGCVFDDEHTWENRPQFARQMMAQTRATGRALKGVVGWSFALLGAESSLAEEMPADEAPAVPAPPKRIESSARTVQAPASTELALAGKPPRPRGATLQAVIAEVDEKVSKAGKPYWRVAVEEPTGTRWMTSFRPVDPGVVGRKMVLVMGTTAKGDTVVEDVYEAASEEVPF